MPGTGGAKVLRYYLRTPVDCLIFGSGPEPVDPQRVPSELVFFVVYSTGGRSVEAVGADLRTAFPPPVWQVSSSIPFRGIEVMSVSRNR